MPQNKIGNILSVDLEASVTRAVPDGLRVLVNACEAYQAAIARNDVAELTRRFLPSDAVVRFGFSDSLWGSEAIAVFIAARQGSDWSWRRARARVTLLDARFGLYAAEFEDVSASQIVRISQSWMLHVDDWMIVHAHLSLIDAKS